MLSAAQSPLYPCYDAKSEISVAIRMLSIKFDYNMPSKAVIMKSCILCNKQCQLVIACPMTFIILRSWFYYLEVGCQKIDYCPNSCMLYYKDD